MVDYVTNDCNKFFSYGLLLEELSKGDERNYPTKEIVNDIYPKLIEKWLKANALFITLVINDEQYIINKLKKARKEATIVLLRKADQVNM